MLGLCQQDNPASAITIEATFKALQKMREAQALLGYPVPTSIREDKHLKPMMKGLKSSTADDANRYTGSLVDHA